MAHNIPTWGLAAGLVALGMAWYQAIFTIMVANVIVLIPMLLNSHAGTKYGIPYPVFARASFGVFGANLPALMRAGVACGWFGIQTWIGGGAIFVVMGTIFGEDSWWTDASKIAIGFGDPLPWTHVAELRDLLGAEHPDHHPRHGRGPALRELGGPVRPDRRGLPARSG